MYVTVDVHVTQTRDQELSRAVDDRRTTRDADIAPPTQPDDPIPFDDHGLV
ncbi:hypothetical protein ACFP2T_27685 [Plantactinospora solaniradicis]|uniref:Uncharacterized protein n=1 Tax=Plantactinospora solaniradicis TaxID=1723736 RepID=A0ABW1KEF6_9ACTN